MPFRIWPFMQCHVAVCEHKLSAKLWSRQCTINKVVYQKKKSRLQIAWTSRWGFESYSVMAVPHEVTHMQRPNVCLFLMKTQQIIAEMKEYKKHESIKKL